MAYAYWDVNKVVVDGKCIGWEIGFTSDVDNKWYPVKDSIHKKRKDAKKCLEEFLYMIRR